MKKIFLVLILLGSPLLVQAKCVLAADSLGEDSPTSWSTPDEDKFDNSAVVQSNVQFPVSIDAKGNTTSGMLLDYEAFLRSDADGSFQVLPLPLFFEIDLRRFQDIVYVCAHINTLNPKENISYVYFLHNRKISPVLPMPLPIQQARQFVRKLFAGTPLELLKWPFKIGDDIQEDIIHFFADVTKLGVDRVRITDTEVQLFSGGDPGQFDSYALRKTIPLN